MARKPQIVQNQMKLMDNFSIPIQIRPRYSYANVRKVYNLFFFTANNTIHSVIKKQIFKLYTDSESHHGNEGFILYMWTAISLHLTKFSVYRI